MLKARHLESSQTQVGVLAHGNGPLRVHQSAHMSDGENARNSDISPSTAIHCAEPSPMHRTPLNDGTTPERIPPLAVLSPSDGLLLEETHTQMGTLDAATAITPMQVPPLAELSPVDSLPRQHSVGPSPGNQPATCQQQLQLSNLSPVVSSSQKQKQPETSKPPSLDSAHGQVDESGMDQKHLYQSTTENLSLNPSPSQEDEDVHTATIALHTGARHAHHDVTGDESNCTLSSLAQPLSENGAIQPHVCVLARAVANAATHDASAKDITVDANASLAVAKGGEEQHTAAATKPRPTIRSSRRCALQHSLQSSVIAPNTSSTTTLPASEVIPPVQRISAPAIVSTSDEQARDQNHRPMRTGAHSAGARAKSTRKRVNSAGKRPQRKSTDAAHNDIAESRSRRKIAQSTALGKVDVSTAVPSGNDRRRGRSPGRTRGSGAVVQRLVLRHPDHRVTHKVLENEIYQPHRACWHF